MFTRKQIDAFRDSITPGDRLVIEQRGWWRGDGGDPDMYQRVTHVGRSKIKSESYSHPQGNEGFSFTVPAKVGDVIELTEDFIAYDVGPKRYRWGFRIERAS